MVKPAAKRTAVAASNATAAFEAKTPPKPPSSSSLVSGQRRSDLRRQEQEGYQRHDQGTGPGHGKGAAPADSIIQTRRDRR